MQTSQHYYEVMLIQHFFIYFFLGFNVSGSNSICFTFRSFGFNALMIVLREIHARNDINAIVNMMR